MTREEILQATRDELVSYLESWGFACFSFEDTEALRIAALENLECES